MRTVDRMVGRETRQRTRDAPQFLERGLVKHPVHVVVVIVHEQEAAARKPLAQDLVLLGGKAHRQVAGEKSERVTQQFRRA